MSLLVDPKGGENLILPNFIKNFDYVFEDNDCRFVGDKKLKVIILSSLTLEFVNSTDQIVRNNISRKMYFIDSGKVDVFYKDRKHKLVTLETGSYFGDISLLF